MLQAEALAAQASRSEAEALLAAPVPALPELRQLEVRRLIDLASLRPAQEARDLLQRARQSVADPDLAIRISLGEGSLAGGSDPKFADEAFRTALGMARRQSNPYWEPLALNNLSYSSRRQGRYEEAIDFGLQALASAQKIGAHRIEAMARNNMVPAYRYLGDLDPALVNGKEAARIFESIGARRDLMIVLGELGLVYDTVPDYAKAVEYHKKAYEIACELHHPDAARFAANLATAYIRANQWDSAAEWNERAEKLTRESKATSEISYFERNRAWIAFGRGNTEEAVRICRELLQSEDIDPVIRWASYDLLGSIDAAKKNFPQANREFESALETIEGARTDVSGSSNRITLLSRLITFYQDYVDVLAHQQGDDAGALRVVESSRARVLAERLGQKSERVQFAGLAAMQRFAKSTNSSLLSFWIAPNRSFAWLITSGGTRRFELPGAAEIEKLVTDYRAIVEHSLWDPIAARKPEGPALWNELMAEIAAAIPKGSRVIVIPDGPLHRLNLETLVVPAPQPHYWIEDVELAIAPSITIAVSPPPAAPRPSPSLLLIGAPEYKGTGYEPLAGANREIQDIQARFPGIVREVRSGALATPAAYRKADPARFSLIHFAAHAEANPEQPLESAVVLARQSDTFKLYARDVIAIPIHADLVTLSACHSAGSRAYAGEGLIGFAWAFLHAGARAVVAGLWDASDISTEPLMDRFYQVIAARQDPVAALRDAKLALLRGDPRYRKPFYWASFQAYLGSAAR